MLRITTYIIIVFLSVISICNSNIAIAEEGIYHINQDRSKAVFFIYYHIGEDQYPNSNLPKDIFIEHVQELKESNYNVLNSLDAIEKLKSNTPLPQHSVIITFEGGYRSSFENAIPTLLKNKIPFTIFIAPERIDRNSNYYMSWKEIKKLSKNRLVTIGALPFSYKHIIYLPKEEQMRSWTRSIARFKEELGFAPQIFAWPYGEYTKTSLEIVKNYNFKAGFGQHSGVVYMSSNFMTLPRFSMTDEYGDLDRFRLAATSMPLPVNDEKPKEIIINTTKPLEISFKLLPELENTEDISCFMSGIGKLNTKVIDSTIVKINTSQELLEKRLRMNCTMPVIHLNEEKELGQQYWRWHGRLFINNNSYEYTDNTTE